MRKYASSWVKRRSRCFCWFPAAILVDSFCPPIWRLHTKLYKGAWNVSATNSETVGHKDLRFGQIVYILVFYNISFSWLLPLDGFKCIFWCRVYYVTVKTKNKMGWWGSPTDSFVICFCQLFWTWLCTMFSSIPILFWTQYWSIETLH